MGFGILAGLYLAIFSAIVFSFSFFLADQIENKKKRMILSLLISIVFILFTIALVKSF